MYAEIESDFAVYGDECVFGGGKVIRDGMGQSCGCPPADSLDTVITNAVIIDYSGIIRNTAKKCYISTFEFLEDLYEYHIPDEYKDFMNGKGAAWKEAENVMQEMKDE